jgi:uncharacterized protein with PQ loop repeat
MEIFLGKFSIIVLVSFLVAVMSILIKVIGVGDQMRKNHERKSTTGLSWLFYLISFLTFFLWGVYGWLKEDWIIFWTQGVLGCIATGVVLFQFFLYRDRSGS